MVPLLLLLLGLGTQANKVRVSISDGVIKVTLPNIEVTESLHGHSQCRLVGIPCILFNGTGSVNNSQVFDYKAELVEQPVQRTYFSILNAPLSFTLYLCNNILPYVRSLNTPTADQERLLRLLYIWDLCKEFFLSNNMAKKTFLHVETQLIKNIMEISRDNTPVTFRLKTMSISVLKMNDSILSCNGPECSIPLDLPQLLSENAPFNPSIQLPMSALRTLPEEKRLIGLVSYSGHNQFQFEQDDIRSMVIRIELLRECHLQNLSEPINMIFPLAHTNDFTDSDLQCQFLDQTEWKWKADGCETSITHQSSINCSCNHATPFAVLLIRGPIDSVHWEILSYISYIGCGLSAFFTSLSIVIFVFRRKHKMDSSISIHISLSGALLLLNATFLLTEWGATVEPVWVCVFVAALMHYSLLCSFTWMAVEALHLYLLLIKVFNTYYKHYMVKLSLVGWGIPAIIVAASLGAQDSKHFYGVTGMAFSDSNKTSAMCWITDESFFYALNLVYFTLIFVFNAGILMTVACSICKMRPAPKPAQKIEAARKTWRPSAGLSASCRNGLTMLGLTCLMGTTWGLAFLGGGYINYPILYLFCILNSTQGFFIFLWIVLSMQKQERSKHNEKMHSTPAKTTTTKLE